MRFPSTLEIPRAWRHSLVELYCGCALATIVRQLIGVICAITYLSTRLDDNVIAHGEPCGTHIVRRTLWFCIIPVQFVEVDAPHHQYYGPAHGDHHDNQESDRGAL